MIPIKSFRERRRALASQMQSGVAIVPTAPERVRNRDAHFPYRFDSYFYYLTGFREPEAVLVIVADAEKAHRSTSCSAAIRIPNAKSGMVSAMAPRRRGKHSTSMRHIRFSRWTRCCRSCWRTSLPYIVALGDDGGLGYARDRLDQPGTAAVAQRSRRALRSSAISDFCWTRCGLFKSEDELQVMRHAAGFPRRASAGNAECPARHEGIRGRGRTAARVSASWRAGSRLYAHRRGRRQRLHTALCGEQCPAERQAICC